MLCVCHHPPLLALLLHVALFIFENQMLLHTQNMLIYKFHTGKKIKFFPFLLFFFLLLLYLTTTL